MAAPLLLVGLAVAGVAMLRGTKRTPKATDLSRSRPTPSPRSAGAATADEDFRTLVDQLEEDSTREDDAPMRAADPYRTPNDCGAVVASSLGWPYWWGRGGPGTPWISGPKGVDCSGYVQMALVRLNILPPSAPDRSAATLADDCDPVPVGQQEPGDIAIYPGHVMLVTSRPDPVTGHSEVCGASGGGRDTVGDKPKAKVKVFASATYRRDFVCYGRLKPTFRA